MNEKQIYWIYNKLKNAIKGVQGLPLNLSTTADLYDEAERIIATTKKSRDEDQKIDDDVTSLIGWFFKIIHSAEALNKPL